MWQAATPGPQGTLLGPQGLPRHITTVVLNRETPLPLREHRSTQDRPKGGILLGLQGTKPGLKGLAWGTLHDEIYDPYRLCMGPLLGLSGLQRHITICLPGLPRYIIGPTGTHF